MLWALAACDESTDTTPDDPSVGDEGDAQAAEDDQADATPKDASTPTRRDASSADAAAADDAADAGDADGGMAEMMADAGRRQRDAGTAGADAGVPQDAAAPSATDAAVPPGDLCAPTASWDASWAAYEDEVLRLTNEARSKGASCGAEGTFAPAAPLTMEPRLRCAARLYSKEMLETGNFSHTSKDGTTFDKRIANTGYRGRRVGENIAAGYPTPEAVVAGWLKSDGHCANIMAPGYTEIGVGYYTAAGAKPHWTQDFGTPF